MQFSENQIFSYNRKRKIVSGLSLILGATAAAVLVIYLYLNKEILAFGVLRDITAHVLFHVQNSTVLGVLYSTSIGGLFFLSIPLELLFIRFLGSYTPLAVILLYMIGLAISFTANYIIGARFSNLSKRLITPKRFYKTKGLINRHGALAVYILNVLPFTSQPLSALLGVFRYNQTRFYVFFTLGQLTKYTLIALAL